MNVKTITDQFRPHPQLTRGIKDGSHGARRPVRQAVHSVEQMGGVTGTLGKGHAYRIIIRVGVGDGYRANGLNFPYKIHSAGFLRSDIHQPDAAVRRAVQPPKFLNIRRTDKGAVLRSLLFCSDIGSLHIDALYIGAG